MRNLVFLSLLVAVCGVSSRQWLMFKLSHGKKYQNITEERFRRSVFLENKMKIDEHNKRYKEGLVSYKLRMNHFGDLTNQEYQLMMNRLKTSPMKPNLLKASAWEDKEVEVPESMDWRERGAVTPVKDQGKCGACWSFSATGAMEAQHFLKTGELTSLSEQNLIDCSTEYGNDGCDGGLMEFAFQYVVDNDGVDTENSYPYEGPMGDCRFETTNVGTTASGFVNIPQGDEEALRKAVATIGPISAGVDGHHYSFQFYAGGLYYENYCTEDVDHAVLVVGYGTDDDGEDYWILKNSWNSTWGEGGYMRLARNKNNHCGITNKTSYPKL